MTQTELDQLCLMAQHAITVLINDFISLYRRQEINLKVYFAKVSAVNDLMRSIQHYSLEDWTNLTDDDLLQIKSQLTYLSDWR